MFKFFDNYGSLKNTKSLKIPMAKRYICKPENLLTFNPKHKQDACVTLCE